MSLKTVVRVAPSALLVAVMCSPVSAIDPADVDQRPRGGEGAQEPVASSTREHLDRLLASAPPAPEGDAATACEVILCLAGSAGAGGGVSECAAPIRKYLTVKPWRRLNFLKLCPKTSGQGDAQMDRLVELMADAPGADGEGRICSAAAINTVNTVQLGEGLTYIANAMPSDCEAYYQHPYTDLAASVPVYVGEPMKGGFWAEPDDQAAAGRRYEAERETRRTSGASPAQPPRSAYSTL